MLAHLHSVKAVMVQMISHFVINRTVCVYLFTAYFNLVQTVFY